MNLYLTLEEIFVFVVYVFIVRSVCQKLWVAYQDTLVLLMPVENNDRIDALAKKVGISNLRICSGSALCAIGSNTIIIGKDEPYSDAFIYHELGHLKYKHLTKPYNKSTMCNAFMWGFYAVRTYAFIYSKSNLSSIIIFVVSCFVYSRYMRQFIIEQEKEADLFAVSQSDVEQRRLFYKDMANLNNMNDPYHPLIQERKNMIVDSIKELPRSITIIIGDDSFTYDETTPELKEFEKNHRFMASSAIIIYEKDKFNVKFNNGTFYTIKDAHQLSHIELIRKLHDHNKFIYMQLQGVSNELKLSDYYLGVDNGIHSFHLPTDDNYNLTVESQLFVASTMKVYDANKFIEHLNNK
jgi:hypothetical protein